MIKKKYKLLLFDLDDTLLDFVASQRLSFFKTLDQLDTKIGHDSLYNLYSQENQKAWHRLERGEIDKDQLQEARFMALKDRTGSSLSPREINDIYMNFLPETVVLMENAIEVCEELKQNYDMGIVTNGIGAVQGIRIDNSGLRPHFRFVVNSEQAGFPKPDRRFFDYALQQAPNIDKKNMLVIGDRWNTDIVGAMEYGLDCCWFNPKNKERPSNLEITMEIQGLKDLLQIL